MKKIPLTQGKFAFIDDEDYPIVSLFNWFTQKCDNIFYAITHVEINNKRTTLRMHRLILNLKSHEITDHSDMDGLNNQRYNLRKCTYSQNRMNGKGHRGSSSQYRGVCWHKQNKKWVTQARFKKKVINLGYFSSEIEAAKIYDNATKVFYKEFARLNFPEKNINV